MSSTELSLIDSGIDSLCKIPLNRQTRVLNLHCNNVRTIENLHSAPNLLNLDLSSNRLSIIQGLDALIDLRTLNLSCNQISKVQGLQNLRSLTHLNLSYNKISDIAGLRVLTNLIHLDIRGNKITRIDDVTKFLSTCMKLRDLLLLTKDSNTNPVCNLPDYRERVLSGLTQLSALDGVNRDGIPSSPMGALHLIPDLEDWMEFLNVTSSTQGKPMSSMDTPVLVTPNIDQVLNNYRSRSLSSSAATTNASMETVVSSSGVRRSLSEEPTGDGVATATEQDDRLKYLEQQIAQLMSDRQKVPGSTPSSSLDQAKNDLSGDVKAAPNNRAAPSAVSVVESLYNHDDTDTSDNQSRQTTPKGQRSRKIQKTQADIKTKRSNSGPSKSKKLPHSPHKPKLQHSSSRSPNRRELSPTVVTIGDGVVCHDDEKKKDLESTYLNLMSELETERERRCKSEQSLMKLVNHVKVLENKANEGLSLQHTAIDATAKLKAILAKERETNYAAQQEIQSLKEDVKALTAKLEKSEDLNESRRLALERLRDTGNKQEAEHVKQHIIEAKKTQDSQMKCAALSRELDILKSSLETVKIQLQQTQELLTNREQEHREDLKGRYTLESPELQTVIEREARKAEKVHAHELSSIKKQLQGAHESYKDLENEFRLALQIEASRYNEIQVAFEQCNQDHSQCKKMLSDAAEKDGKASKLISELTAMVKEQKGRISELVKAKQDQSADHKDRIQYLEAHVEEARKRMIQFELLKKEKAEIESELHAQQSVVQGLRAERKIWGKELAQQGSSLAQDRGRMEAKIETLECEVTSLKAQLEREADAIRIKTKIIEDQTDSIRKLKEGVIEREGDVKTLREDILDQQRMFEEQITEEKAASQELNEAVERLKTRKEELKDQLSTVQAELAESKKSHSCLQNKWREKSDLIGQLEHQVTVMRDAWEAKQKTLSEERDAAINTAREAAEKLRTVDDAFRAQLDAKESAHQEALLVKDETHLQELAAAQQRVVEVEAEMRSLLKEAERSKKDNDAKIKRLTDVFAELQNIKP